MNTEILRQLNNPSELESNRKNFVEVFLEELKGKGAKNILNNFNDLI